MRHGRLDSGRLAISSTLILEVARRDERRAMKSMSGTFRESSFSLQISQNTMIRRSLNSPTNRR